MLDQRVTRPVLALSAALLLFFPALSALPAHAAAPTPTPTQLRAAHAKVAAAKLRVHSLQGQAELAAEAYNGAVYRAGVAAAAAVRARAAAARAESAYSVASDVARAAQSAAMQAAHQADLALAAQQAAQDVADTAQLTLDRMAAGAFQTGGQMGMAAQLFVARDPLELANGRNLMNSVGAFQQKVIVVLTHARQAATAATVQANDSKGRAQAAADQAARALERADQSKNEAVLARSAAVASQGHAAQVLAGAGVYRQRALVLVARAEAALGSAVHSAASLEKAAAAARAAAKRVQTGTIPNDAAGIAIHWAFQEIGLPYSWGGGTNDGPSRGFAQGANTVGFDCSGLTMFAYHKAGIQLGHYTGSQWDQGKRITSTADLLPGDLLYFAHDISDPGTIHHVALYLGNGKMIEAPQTGDVVKVSSSTRSDFIGATRPWQR